MLIKLSVQRAFDSLREAIEKLDSSKSTEKVRMQTYRRTSWTWAYNHIGWQAVSRSRGRTWRS